MNTSEMGPSQPAEYDPMREPKQRPKYDDPGWKYEYLDVIGNRDWVRCSLCKKRIYGGIKTYKENLA